MIKAISNYIDQICEKGLHWPFLLDPTTGKPSVTLLFLYITFLNMMGSVIALYFFPNLLTPTIVSVGIWSLSMVFYRMRKIDDFNFNLKTGSVEVKGDDGKKGDQ